VSQQLARPCRQRPLGRLPGQYRCCDRAQRGEWDAGALGSMTVLKVGSVFHIVLEAWEASEKKGVYRLPDASDRHAVSPDSVQLGERPANPVLRKGTGKDWDKDGTWDPFRDLRGWPVQDVVRWQPPGPLRLGLCGFHRRSPFREERFRSAT